MTPKPSPFLHWPDWLRTSVGWLLLSSPAISMLGWLIWVDITPVVILYFVLFVLTGVLTLVVAGRIRQHRLRRWVLRIGYVIGAIWMLLFLYYVGQELMTGHSYYRSPIIPV